MENMGTYFKDEPKKTRWDSGQSILHRENRKTKKQENGQKPYEVKNAYGKLDYRKKDKKTGQQREGFALEAVEAAGTPVHTEKEKHLDRASMKKVNHGEKKTLYSSEVPLRNQALFYDMSGSKKSSDFLKCMKQLIHRRGHQTLKDAFGFLEQEPERLELLAQREMDRGLLPREKEGETASAAHEKDSQSILSLEEFSQKNKRIDTLNSRLLRKEAKERQLRNELQAMLDERTKKERFSGSSKQTPKHDENQPDSKGKRSHDISRTRLMQPQTEDNGAVSEKGEDGQNDGQDEEHART